MPRAGQPLGSKRSYDRHAAGLYRYAAMVLADPAAAADVVQQVFFAMWRTSGATSIVDTERYLRRAVRNECFSAAARSSNRS
jgi:DNA-directed RNA polymerase specialized sigma24 family protein